MRTRQAGLTRLHVLIAVAAIGFVGLVVKAQWQNYRERTVEQTVRKDLKQLSEALDFFQLSVGRFPTEREGLGVLLYDPGIPGWDGPYLSTGRLPLDPWGGTYRYELKTGDTFGFALYSCGRDGRPGTQDDIGSGCSTRSRERV